MVARLSPVICDRSADLQVPGTMSHPKPFPGMAPFLHDVLPLPCCPKPKHSAIAAAGGGLAAIRAAATGAAATDAEATTAAIAVGGGAAAARALTTTLEQKLSAQQDTKGI